MDGHAQSSPHEARKWPSMWRLALPVLIEESLTMFVGLTDWWLAGHYLQTADHKAAMGLLAYLLWLLTSLFSAVAIGATALIARAIGGGDAKTASRVAQQALICGGVLAFVMTGVAAWGGRSFVGLLQLSGEPAELVWSFLRFVIPTLPFIMLEQVGTACLRGAGDTISGCVAKGLVNVVNLIVSPVLLLGLGGAPRLGWEGLAIGTSTAHVLGGILILILMLRGRARMRIRFRELRPSAPLIRRLLHIGVPGGIDVSAVVVCHLAYVAIINSLGTLASAAHGLGLQIESLSYLPGSAFQVAAATLAGQYLGAGDARQARRSVLLTCLAGCTMMSCAGAAFLFAGRQLTTFFTGNPNDAATLLAADLLTIVAVSTPSLGVMHILTGGLRGAGDTRLPLLITFVGLIGVRLPGACWLAWEQVAIPGTSLVITGWGMGVAGAWWAMTSDVIVRSLLIAARFLHGGWMRVRV